MWARARDLVQKTVDSGDEFDIEEVADMRAKAGEIKRHQMIVWL